MSSIQVSENVLGSPRPRDSLEPRAGIGSEWLGGNASAVALTSRSQPAAERCQERASTTAAEPPRLSTSARDIDRRGSFTRTIHIAPVTGRRGRTAHPRQRAPRRPTAAFRFACHSTLLSAKRGSRYARKIAPLLRYRVKRGNDRVQEAGGGSREQRAGTTQGGRPPRASGNPGGQNMGPRFRGNDPHTTSRSLLSALCSLLPGCSLLSAPCSL
jgi:hypothetical protein